MPPTDQPTARQAVEEAFREHRTRVLAALVGGLRDFELAEDVLQEAFALALERWPRQGAPRTPGGVAVHGGAQPRDRPAAPSSDRRAEARGAGRRRGGPGGAGPGPREARRGRRRAPVAAVHVLPPGARARGARRADAPGGRRADRRGDRARVPGSGRHDVAAPGARQAQDPRRRDLIRPAGGRGAARPPRRGAVGHLPDLQRGLRRDRRRGPGANRVVRRGAAPRQAAGLADARPARGPRASRADAVPRLAAWHAGPAPKAS